MVLHLRQPAPDQWRNSKCLGKVFDDKGNYQEELDPFFTPDREEEAVDFCRGADGKPVCPLIEQCLIFALVNNEKHGTWGGHGEIDRKAIRKKWPLRRGKNPRPEWKLFEPGEPASWYAEEDLGDDD